MVKTIFLEKEKEIIPSRSRPSKSERRFHKLTNRNVEKLRPEARSKYLENLRWIDSQIIYLKEVNTWLRKHERHEMPDTYDNKYKTKSLLEEKLKWASEWFNEIWRWFPLGQYKEKLVKDIVVETINNYMLMIPLPSYSERGGLTTPAREIKIKIKIRSEFNEI